ncbi:MarR family transcriptional regulator [Natrinema soli]|uniref:MarR family transcriptional regulator n=1 Tax=Natrinema soli TaxID=1930624 RepID=A0ABD5SJI5_9EURY|nr:helix-turn-helix domain-containing protein [Natrinema soli]
MPVDFREYSADQGRIDLTEGTNARTLLSFLLEHQGIGFTPAELHEEAGVARGSVSPTLSRLEQAGLVRHEGNYWAAAEDDRLAAASASIVGLATVEEDYGDDWYGQNPDWAEDLPDLSEE